jgi:NAD(P)-dependent dehydrogenase (short-subunit alcohol dehydrogenase family)
MEFRPDRPPVFGLQGAANVLVTGASSGIGLAMLGQLLEHRHVARAFAVSRSATRSDALVELRRQHGERLECLDADLTREEDMERLSRVMQCVDALHLVVNAAGILHDGILAPEKSVEQVRRDSLERVFALNAFAPVMLARALMPQLCGRHPAVFASLSARVGSIGDNRAGGWYAYRASKAAQNQLMKTFSIEWRRRNRLGVCLLLHPGTVDTPLSTPFQVRVPADRLFEPAAAAANLLDLIAGMTAADSGRFLAWDGTDVPW